MKRILMIAVFALVSSVTAQEKAPQQKAPPPQQSRGVPTIKVWVDTEFGFYHCPSTKLYGKTKQGVYMTQKQAQDRGYRPAYGTYCNILPPKPNAKAPSKAPAK